MCCRNQKLIFFNSIFTKPELFVVLKKIKYILQKYLELFFI